MSALKPNLAETAALPPRLDLSEMLLADEDRLVSELIAKTRFTGEEQTEIAALAETLVNAARAGRHESGGVDSFLQEYGLSSREGVLLLCLSEALLRIPDSETADRLIAGTIGSGDWKRHLGRSSSLLVNASTYGLMLTGRVLDWSGGEGSDLASLLQRLIGRSGEPMIRQALRQGMRILGKQFVLGEDIGEALDNADDELREGERLSIDMLGEAARTAKDAERYTANYLDAISAVGEWAGSPDLRNDAELHSRPGLSVKLSALHPRYQASQAELLGRELLPRLKELALFARDHWLGLTLDAEEQDKLELSLSLMAPLLTDPDLADWNGLGLALQAYGKRALPFIAWLQKIGAASGRSVPVRLVKGAYWDSEIKWAQDAGFSDYPVFTRKVNTDVAYLAAARALLAAPNLYPQFATHNAHTAAAVAILGGDREFEYQRLYGMGEALHREMVRPETLGRPSRVYAPVGGHKELLAYLVRRLLENGANASFVNRLADDDSPIDSIVADPIKRAGRLSQKRNPMIPVPPLLFAPERRNSLGLPLWDRSTRLPLLEGMQRFLSAPAHAAPIVAGKKGTRGGEALEVTSPHDRRLHVGAYVAADGEAIDQALTAARAAADAWDERGGEARAKILERAADLFEQDRAALMALLVREGGKTLTNAQSELREAVDTLRYSAAEARLSFSAPLDLKGPTGEANVLSLHGRGVFACISPWNFPLAIFTGQIAAALAAGNAAIAKPAEQTPLIAARAVWHLQEAGIPPEVMQFLPGSGATIGAALVRDPRIDGVAFTGGTDTGIAINRALAARDGPIGRLIAETGGQNCMIVDSSALPEQATRDALVSAFDSAGQRCSALRILFLQEDVAETMIEMLVGATETLTIGDPIDFATDIGPVIDAEAKRALEQHKARMRSEAVELIDLRLPVETRHGTYVAPAIYEIPSLSLLKGEVFGPILHIVRFAGDRLGEVCEAINATGFGLTCGVHSRVPATAEFVASRVKAGNVYVNRTQIGAVVGVQPFGGEGLSGTGPKAGGPNYLKAFALERVRSTDLTASGGNASLLAAAGDAE